MVCNMLNNDWLAYGWGCHHGANIQNIFKNKSLSGYLKGFLLSW